jgi:hypothetical protein
MATSPQDWPQLVRIALLGTQQTTEPVPVLSGFGPAAEGVAADHREKQVLLTAGAFSLVRKAGFQPLTAPPTSLSVTPAPAETLLPLGALGRQYLPLLLGGRYGGLLPEYLRELARHGRRVPHSQLVALLDYALAHSELHEPTSQVLGQRGQWLTALNPEWQTLRAPDPQGPDVAEWDTGGLPLRRRFLTRLRRSDPQGARELLAAALPQESARSQALLLTALAENQAPDDAPLLEQYLVSKSKEVRQAVLPLLVCLPGSPLVERLWQRAEPLVRLKSTLLNKKLLVSLPEQWDKSWLADGVEQKDSRFQGEKAAWLGQLLSLIPPSRWAAHWGVSPAKALVLAASSEWATLLLTAWREALILHRDAAWALAYAELQFTLDKIPWLSAPEVVALSSIGQAVDLLLAALPRQPTVRQPAPRWEQWLLTMPGPWPAPLTGKVLETIGNTLRTAEPAWRYSLHYQLAQLLRYMEQAVPPAQYELCAAAQDELLAADTGIHTAFAQLLETLDFRRSLLQTLTEPAGPDF